MPVINPDLIRRTILEPALPATVAAVLRWAADDLATVSKGRRDAAARAVTDEAYARSIAYAVGVEQARDRLRALAEEIANKEETEHG
jgi:hypothetical protein